MTARTFNFTAQVTGAPQWFLDLPERTWTDIAGGSAYSGAAWQKGSRIDDVKPANVSSYGTGQTDLVRAWNGATMLQGRGEYLKIAEGGHNTTRENSIYALKLKTAPNEAPGWSRIWGPTALANIVFSHPDTDPVVTTARPIHKTLDFAPSTAHGWFSRLTTEVDERMWIFFSDETNSGVGSCDVWSIRRAQCNGSNDPTLWKYHGQIYPTLATAGNIEIQAAPHAYDPATHRFWVTSSWGQVYDDPSNLRSLDVATMVAAPAATVAGTAVPGTAKYLPPRNGSLVMAYCQSAIIATSSPRCWVCIGPAPYRSTRPEPVIAVLNLENPDAGWRWKIAPHLSVFNYGMSGGYVESSRKFVITGGAGFGPHLYTSEVYTVHVPDNPWDAAAADFTLGQLVTSGTLGVASVVNEASSMIQVVQDMGNGQACLVTQLRLPTGAAQVYKLPMVF